MTTQAEAATELLRRRYARESLLPFVEYTHPSWQSGAHHKRICEQLERVECGEIRRLLIEAPPRHSKSELASRRFPAWYIGKHPERQIITASYNDLIGTDIGRDVRNMVRDPAFGNVFPGVTLAEDSAAAGRWHTNHGGAYLATGVGGTMTGYGAHCIARGQVVRTCRGDVPIESVVVGDYVLTHKMRWQKVLATAAIGKRWVGRLTGHGLDLVCTPDHSIWSGHEWIPASEAVGRSLICMDGIMDVESPLWASGTAFACISHTVAMAFDHCGEDDVFDLQVEDDSSFCVGGVFAHNCLIIDDPHKNREEADSERARDNAWHWYTSTAMTRLMPDGAIVMMLTRWHEDDLAARVLRSEGWEVLKLPAISADGRALWPEWYPLDELMRIKSVLPPRDWHALYQQDPHTDVGTYIKREWFETRYDDAAKLPKPMHVYVVSDFAITEAKEGRDPDYTEHGVFGHASDDKLYVLDWWSGQTTTDVWIDELLRLIKHWKPMCWFGEGGVVGKSIQPILDRMMREQRIYCRTERLSPVNDKASRGRAFQGRAHAGRVIFPRTDWAERVINQCVSFPGGQHDDAFDVMAWMGLAIDQAHSAIAPIAKPVPKKRDYAEREGEGGWKTV